MAKTRPHHAQQSEQHKRRPSQQSSQLSRNSSQSGIGPGIGFAAFSLIFTCGIVIMEPNPEASGYSVPLSLGQPHPP